MAGANKMLKAGQVVFKAGDPADGMYLVRKGELVVFLEQNGTEVILAKIGEGGMIGEMALFDRQPRSASVKASVDTEITLISLDDFGKLMKQIPKWFVGLMTALSGRLRTTNDRLKQLESGGGASSAPATTSSGKPFQNFLRILNVMELLWHRDGTKEGKDWCLARKIVEDSLKDLFSESPDKIAATIDLLIQEQIIVSKVDSYKNVVLALTNRAALRQFADFMTNFTKSNPNLKAIPENVTNILKIVQKLASKAPYEQFTASLEELTEEAKLNQLDTSDWAAAIKTLGTFGEAVKVVKTSTKSAMGLKVIKADFPDLMKNLNAFTRVANSKLNS